MSSDGADLLGFILVGIVLFGLFGGCAVGADSLQCSSTANAMRVNHTWGLFSGCIIEAKPGRWIPLDQYHSVDVSP